MELYGLQALGVEDGRKALDTFGGGMTLLGGGVFEDEVVQEAGGVFHFVQR